MLIRLWFFLCLLWAALLLGINLANGSEQWAPVLALVAAPFFVPVALRFLFAWVVWGSATGKAPKVRVYRR